MNSLVPQDEETLDIILGAYAEVGISVVFSIAVRDIAALDIEPFLPPTCRRRSPPSSAASRETPRPTWPSSRPRSNGSIRCRRVCIGRSALPGRNAARRHCSKALPSFPIATGCRCSLMSTKPARSSPRRARTIPNTADRWCAIWRMLACSRDARRSRIASTSRNDEIEDVARAGAGVVHNPLANLKLKNGVAPLFHFKRAGHQSRAGMRQLQLQRLPEPLPVDEVVHACWPAAWTQNRPASWLAMPSRRRQRRRAAVGLAGNGGRNPAGNDRRPRADRPDRLAYLPFNSAARQLVFSETGRGVQTVLVDGRVVLTRGASLR